MLYYFVKSLFHPYLKPWYLDIVLAPALQVWNSVPIFYVRCLVFIFGTAWPLLTEYTHENGGTHGM